MTPSFNSGWRNRLFSWLFGSIRKSLLAIVIMATLPAMAIIALTGYESLLHAEKDAASKSMNLARSLAAIQLNVADDCKVLLTTLARLPIVRNGDATACNKLFTRLQKDRPDFADILLIGLDGKVIAATLPNSRGADRSDREYYREALETKSFAVSGFIIGRSSKMRIQIFAQPIFTESGAVSGVIAISYLLTGYEDYLRRYTLPPQSRITLVDRNGLRMLSYPSTPFYQLGAPFNPGVWDIITRSPTDEGILGAFRRLTGKSGLYAYCKLRLTDSPAATLTIVVSLAREELFSSAKALFWRNMAFLLLAAALALAVALAIGHAAIFRGLQGLMSATARLGGGDQAARADATRGAKELRQLAATFNGMTQALQSRQEELRESVDTIGKMRSMLNNILESMPSAVIGVNREDVITHWNTGATKLCGVTQEQALGKRLDDVFPWLTGHVPNPGRVSRDAPPVILQKCSFMQDEETKFMDVLAYPLVANGIEGAVVRVDDITARVHMEELMVQSEKMSTVGSLAAGMAHDINNPLAGILQSVQNIRRRISPDIQANVQTAQNLGCDLDAIRVYLERREILSFLEAIKNSGERAVSIVRNMLGFIRKGSSAHELVQLEELVDHALELAATDYDLKKKYDFRRIEIVREYSPDLPKFKCSPSDIEQVFYNLAANAAQAMAACPKPGQPPKLILRTCLDGDWLVAEVEDNGPGMSENIRKRVFDPLFTTKTPGEGTGLGLAVAYFIIVNTYHGELLVDAVEGRGAKFTIRLPAKEGSPPA